MDISEYLKNMKKYGVRYALFGILEKVGTIKNKKSDLLIQKYYLKLNQDQMIPELEHWFKLNTGDTLNLNKPETFNEKIQWLKVYDSTPLKTRLADKYLVREWIAEEIGDKYLIPLIGQWTSFEDIDFDALPDKFVLKCVHGSGMNIIVKDKNKLDKKAAKSKIDFWMQSYYGIGPMQEWHYRDVPHRIIAEKYMENMSGDLYDYKVYCFNGEPKYIQVITGRYGKSQMAFYDLDWNDSGFSNEHFDKMTEKPPKPKQLDKMLELSKILCKDFAYVRVDFYLIGDEQIYFGEMTFTPASGVSKWVPKEANRMLGDLLKLPESANQFIVKK